MNIQQKIKNTLLLTIVLTIFLIVICIIFLGCGGGTTPVKDGLSLVGNYFSGITTLAAAYIASCLYTDWRVQIKYSEQLKNISKIAVKVNKIPLIIKTIRSDKDNALFLTDCFKYMIGQKKSLNDNLNFNIPDFEDINNLIDELKEALTSMSVYSLKNNEDDIHTEIYKFESSLEEWISGFKKIKNDFNKANISKLKMTNQIDYMYLFCDSSSEFYRLNSDALGAKYSIYNHNEIDIYHDQIAISIALTTFLSNLESF